MMKWALRGVVAVAALACVTYAGVWLAGEQLLARTYDVDVADIPHATDPDEIARGERLAAIYGCLGCHKSGLEGTLFGEAPFIYRSVTPNLPKLAQTYSDADFDRAIRHGVRRNRRSVNGMPSAAFRHMRDDEFAAIVGFIRSLPVVDNDLPTTQIRILGRVEQLRGMFPPEASTIDHGAPRRSFDFADPRAHGEYLATLACAECHGLDFTGDPYYDGEGASPDLVVASGYGLTEFETLMRTGVPIGGRDLQLMDDVARGRFVHFTDAEIAAIHAFLAARAAE